MDTHDQSGHDAGPRALHVGGGGSILFTAFEPSGDAHAAPVIAALLKREPAMHVYAWGGPKMEAAGATLLGRTTDNAAMGVSALKHAGAVRKEVRRIRQWSKQYRVFAHVAVDSPAANFPICKIMKKTGARVVHLVAPQLWAWGGWRIKKLRRRTDLVLCLLPFEAEWFRERDVPSAFVGHPRMNRDPRAEHPQGERGFEVEMAALPRGTPRVGIFPGSRPHEVSANIGLLVNAFTELHERFTGTNGVIFAASDDIAALIRKKVKMFPTGLHLVTGKTDPGIAWADFALAVSGTITLDLTRQLTPMVGVYKTSILSWLAAKVLLRTPFRLLPNIVAQREIVPEFVPHFGGAGAIVREAGRYLNDSRELEIQREELRRVVQRFTNKRPAEESADLILKLIASGAV